MRLTFLTGGPVHEGYGAFLAAALQMLSPEELLIVANVLPEGGRVLSRETLALLKARWPRVPAVCSLTREDGWEREGIRKIWEELPCVRISSVYEDLAAGAAVRVSGLRVLVLDFSEPAPLRLPLRPERWVEEARRADVVVAFVEGRERAEQRRIEETLPQLDVLIWRDWLGRRATEVQRRGGRWWLWLNLREDGVPTLTLEVQWKRVREARLLRRLPERLPEVPTWQEAFRSLELDGRWRAPFSGSLSCRGCHQQIFEAFMQTDHPRAFESLWDGGNENRPECLSCHTTGYGEGGFRNYRDTDILAGVQCEACHGPSLEHVRNPRQRTPWRVTEELCLSCHTSEWSPDFNPRRDWWRGSHPRSPETSGPRVPAPADGRSAGPEGDR